MAQQQYEPSEAEIRAALPVIDITTFQPKNDKLLILIEDSNNSDTLVSEGGITFAEQTTGKLRKAMIAKGILVNMGPKIEDKDMKIGQTVYFYRQNSEGGVKSAKGVAYMLFSEYHIIAYDKGSELTNLAPKSTLAIA